MVLPINMNERFYSIFDSQIYISDDMLKQFKNVKEIPKFTSEEMINMSTSRKCSNIKKIFFELKDAVLHKNNEREKNESNSRD